MKPHIQKLPLSEHSSFLADRFFTPHFETPWHYHIEYEIVLVLKGRGKCFVGNYVGDYEEGDVVLLGPDLPHLFRKEDANATAGSLVIHFKEDFLGPGFWQIPEMQKIQLLFHRSRMGVRILGEKRSQISRLINEITDVQDVDRLICLFRILSALAGCDEYQLLSSPEIRGQNSRDSDRLNKVFDYVMTHFTEEIEVGKVAAIANMSYSGFCRYFKNRTKKNFSHFVNEIRIGYACKRLMEGDDSVRSICFESGFNNITNFNEQFKKIIKCTPYQFKLRHAS